MLDTLGMNFGDARISTGDEAAATQLGTLRTATCERMLHGHASGGRRDLPELYRMLDRLRDGDALIARKTGQPPKSLKDLLSVIEKNDAAGTNFPIPIRSHRNHWAALCMMTQMVGVFARLEREMIHERSHARLERPIKKGHHLGRKRRLSDDQRRKIHDLVQSGKRTEAEVAPLITIHCSTISRVMQESTSDAAA